MNKSRVEMRHMFATRTEMKKAQIEFVMRRRKPKCGYKSIETCRSV